MYEFRLTNDKQHIELISFGSNKEVSNLRHYFKRPATKYYFDPAFRSGYWDGHHEYYNKGYIPIGLWMELKNFLQSRNHPFVVHGLDDFINNNINKERVFEFIPKLIENTEIFEPWWFQLEAVYRILKYRYCSLELATSAGKTLVTYIVFAYLKHRGLIGKNRKFLFVVPRKGLVEQTYKKFTKNYYNGFVPFVAMPLGGKYKFNQKLFDEADIIISTYQSLSNQADTFFTDINHIYVDEAHSVLTNTVQDIIGKCPYLIYRFGMSGTLELNTEKSEFFRMQKYLGPLVMVLKAKDLIEQSYSPDIKIIIVKLEYDRNEKIMQDYAEFLENGGKQFADQDEFAKTLYGIERKIILEHGARKEFIKRFSNSLKMNTLLLFNDVKGSHGKDMVSMMDGDNVFYIDGKTSDNNRSKYAEMLEANNDVKLVASFGTFSTGMDLKNVYNIIFTESYKSPILIRQSIGRGMRGLVGKRSVNIIDIVDMFGKYSKRHAKEREAIYNKQGFKVEYHSYNLSKFAS